MSAPYTIKLDQESARELALRGAALLFLDMPEGCALGMDQQASTSPGSFVQRMCLG
jgi:hypothetical protein